VGYQTTRGEQFYTDAGQSTSTPFPDQATIFKGDSMPKTHRGRMEEAMHDSERYRDSAAECLLASQEASQLYYRQLFLSMAASWLSLAHQDEAIDNLLARWNTDEAIKTDGIVVA
jgi:hypothetical protein